MGKSPYGVSVWKFIRRGWDNFFKYCAFVVGDGKRVKFWHDCWCGDMSLKGAFPELFAISRDREASVDDIRSFPKGILHWDLRFSRNVHDWELESLSNFMELIYSIPLKGEGEDRLGWRRNLNKGFSVKEYYRYLSMTFSLGKVFGRQRSHQGSLSFLGQLLWEDF